MKSKIQRKESKKNENKNKNKNRGECAVVEKSQDWRIEYLFTSSASKR